MKLTRMILLAAFAAAAGNPLGDLAGGLKAGQWGELTGSRGLTQAFLETSGWNTGSHSILQYANKGVWDPGSRQFMFVGSPHDNPHKFIMYSADSNSWRLGPLPLACMNEGAITGCGFTSHGYDHNCMDTVNGDLCLRVRGRDIYRYRVSLGRWLTLPVTPDTVITTVGVASSLEYFPEMGGVVYVNGADGNVGFCNTRTYRWSKLASGLTMGPYHNLSAYSPVHKMVLFGGGNGSTAVYKLTPDGRIAPVQSAPLPLKIQADNNGGSFTADPVTGDFLVFYYWEGRAMYKYNPSANQWVSLGTVPGSVTFDVQGFIVAPVSTYGVIMFLTYSNPPRVYVYKHAEKPNAAEKAALRPSGVLSISPNPGRSAVRLEFPGRADVSIFNVRGQAVVRHEGADGRFLWDARAVPAGVYAARVKTGGAVMTEKILITE